MDEFDMVLPPQGSNQHITCVAATQHFIITGSRQGIIAYYLVAVRILVLQNNTIWWRYAS